jgi:hypothetical protein
VARQGYASLACVCAFAGFAGLPSLARLGPGLGGTRACAAAALGGAENGCGQRLARCVAQRRSHSARTSALRKRRREARIRARRAGCAQRVQAELAVAPRDSASRLLALARRRAQRTLARQEAKEARLARIARRRLERAEARAARVAQRGLERSAAREARLARMASRRLARAEARAARLALLSQRRERLRARSLARGQGEAPPE